MHGIKDRLKDRPLKAEELVNEFNKNGGVDQMLVPEPCMLEAVSVDLSKYITQLSADITKYNDDYSKATKPEDKTKLVNPELVTLLDGPTVIAQIYRKKLQDFVNSLRQPAIDKGITFTVPRIEYAFVMNQKIEHDLRATGNVEGLIFWINGKPLKG